VDASGVTPMRSNDGGGFGDRRPPRLARPDGSHRPAERPFYEIAQVYGTTLKALIEEEFGDGIMSAVDFTMDIRRKPDSKGDRFVVTLDGKFPPYNKY
jgi:cyanase